MKSVLGRFWAWATGWLRPALPLELPPPAELGDLDFPGETYETLPAVSPPWPEPVKYKPPWAFPFVEGLDPPLEDTRSGGKIVARLKNSAINDHSYIGNTRYNAESAEEYDAYWSGLERSLRETLTVNEQERVREEMATRDGIIVETCYPLPTPKVEPPKAIKKKRAKTLFKKKAKKKAPKKGARKPAKKARSKRP